jgi:predicted RNase H-like HicB family nuclease
MKFTIEVEREEDGRWIAEVMDLPGTLVYGKTRKAALAAVEALALRVMADRIEHGEVPAPESFTVSFSTEPTAA